MSGAGVEESGTDFQGVSPTQKPMGPQLLCVHKCVICKDSR